ncbi:hypothetical protein CBR_g31805 [Chara braunii]|uniref:Uncharacterized protein n=1 Tax=Chara braunii TaxID=69332 RepID=A0A388LFP5_CHABU|nr:hypothetical protein CBR_g31805 [Chara braunii]|eukprot:GBG81129.1 hypothetical protein CBR_g31805 [Chara braunii]
MRCSQRLAECESKGTKPQLGPQTPRIPCRQRTAMAAAADLNMQASPSRPVTPPMPVRRTDELQLAFLERRQKYTETAAAELRKWEEEEAACKQAIQRQLEEAEEARQQAAAEAAATTRLQQRQVEASQTQARYQAAMDLLTEESTYRNVLQQQHFRAIEEQEEPTEDERNRETTTVLIENLLYTCNCQQRELLAMRQIFIRHKGMIKAMDKKIVDLQAANSILQAADSQQQAINDRLQTFVNAGLARLSAVESTGGAVSDCSPALAAQTKQFDEWINHIVASLGNISKFARASTAVSCRRSTTKFNNEQLLSSRMEDAELQDREVR